MELILLRHGAAPGNLLHQYIGCTDQPLASEGAKQARRRSGTLRTPDLLFSSPLLRCRQTAALVWPDCPVEVVEGLRETDFGDFEEKTWAELKDNPAYVAWIDGTGECPGGESRIAAAARMLSAGEACLKTALAQQADCCALVTHGGVIMELMRAHCGGTLYDWQPPLCGGWTVSVDTAGNWLNPKSLGEVT